MGLDRNDAARQIERNEEKLLRDLLDLNTRSARGEVSESKFLELEFSIVKEIEILQTEMQRLAKTV